jgi:ATP/maltotriose-dependent transcriptional regulator MalT
VATVFQLSHLAWAYAELGQIAEAWRCIEESMTQVKMTNEKWFEAEINRIAGEIALMAPKTDEANPDAAAKAEAYLTARLRSRVISRPNPGNSAPQ